MSIKIKRQQINNVQEQKLLTSLITNDQFCKDLIPLLDISHFNNNYSKQIFKWILDYYNQFGEAPKNTIQDIFNLERSKIEEEDEGIISSFLEKLSDDYEKGFNEQYVISQAEKYIRERALQVHCEKVLSLIKLGRVDEAEEENAKYKKIARLASGCINPNDYESIDKFFNKTDDDGLIKFPGALGELTGSLKRGWFVVVQGKYKGGKTQCLQTIRNLGLKNRLNVFDASLEMPENAMLSRHYRAITGMPEEAETLIFPSFDCRKNQLGICSKNYKTNRIALYNKGDDITKTKVAPEFYKPCTYCRKKADLKDDYETCVVYKNVEKYGLNANKVKKKVDAIKRTYGDCLRFKCYPRGTANVSDIKRDLDILEFTEGWTPDILIVDYLQILKPEYGSSDNEEQKVNDSAVALSGLASERKILVCSASQVKTSALGKAKTKMGDGSNSARAIYAHTDLVLGIGKDDKDQHDGILLANIVAARHKTYSDNIVVQILQQLDAGQTYIDSEFYEDEN